MAPFENGDGARPEVYPFDESVVFINLSRFELTLEAGAAEESDRDKPFDEKALLCTNVPNSPNQQL